MGLIKALCAIPTKIHQLSIKVWGIDQENDLPRTLIRADQSEDIKGYFIQLFF